MITERQRLERTKRVYASDAPSLFGVGYKSLGDIFLEKTQELSEFAVTKAMEAGTHLEMGVLAYAESVLGKLRRNPHRVHQTLPLGAHLDATVIADGNPVEAKTSGILGPLPPGWGDEDTEEVPEFVAVQCHVHMIVTGKKLCHVPALLSWRGFCMFHVNYNEEFGELLKNRVRDFWTNNVLAGVAPNEPASRDVLKRLHREPGTRAEIDRAVVDEWKAAQAISTQADKDKEAAHNALLAALGTSEASQVFDDNKEVTFFHEPKKAHWRKATNPRVLRLRKVKA